MKARLLLFFVLLFSIAKAQNWGVHCQYSLSTTGIQTSVSPIDNSVCVTGGFGGNYHNPGPHEGGGFVRRYSATGSLLWEKIYYAHGINVLNKTDSHGNIYVAGKFNGTMEHDSSILYTGHSFLFKYDPNGNLLFALQDSNSFVNHMAIDRNNNIYLAGNLAMNPNTVFGQPFDKEYFLAKFDENGNSIWVKYFYSYESSTYDFGFCLDAQGNIYSTGTYNQYYNSYLNDSVQLQNTGGIDSYVAKYDPNLNLLWVKTITGPAEEVCSRIAVNPSGDIFVGGYIDSPSNYPNHYFDTITIYGATQDIFLAKYSNLGNCEWVKRASGSSSPLVNAIYVDNTNVFITGYVYAFGGGNITFENQTIYDPNGNGIMYLAQYNTSGTLTWLAASSGDQGLGYDVTGNGQNVLYLTGRFSGTWSFANVALTGNQDMYLIKMQYNANTSSGSSALTSVNDGMLLYPSPSAGNFTVSYHSEQSGDLRLLIRNELGQLVYSESKRNFSGEFLETIDLSTQPKGIYFIEVTCGNERCT